jgi:hypothetical protein
MSHSLTSPSLSTVAPNFCEIGTRRTRVKSTEFEVKMAEHEQSMRSPKVPDPRYRIQIGRSSPAAETIATILTWHGGICLDCGAARVYELPSEAAYDAALIAVRSVYGWTSVEPRY